MELYEYQGSENRLSPETLFLQMVCSYNSPVLHMLLKTLE